jgi:phosphodiesterase/alkaline phosphatase D-like protein
VKNLSSALVAAALFFAIHSVSLTAQMNSQAGSEMSVTNGPVAEYISDSTATIGWSTGQPTNMTVRYGTDRTKLTQTASPTGSGEARNHHVHLERLTPGTRYFFQLYEGSDRVGGVGTFSTVEKGETPERSKVTIPE